MKIACIGYRDWAIRIYNELAQDPKHDFIIIKSKEDFNENLIFNFNPDLILFYGWSWLVSNNLLNKYSCLMLHPSPLPLYRGGSPIQNQIIAGDYNSAVTIFIMTSELDAGDIVVQVPLSLEGSLDEIFSRIEKLGVIHTKIIIEDGLKSVSQDHSKATFCKRLNPSDSEITLTDLKEAPAQYLFDKIRMLADPYPNAFIRTADGKKLFITSAYVLEE